MVNIKLRSAFCRSISVNAARLNCFLSVLSECCWFSHSGFNNVGNVAVPFESFPNSHFNIWYVSLARLLAYGAFAICLSHIFSSRTCQACPSFASASTSLSQAPPPSRESRGGSYRECRYDSQFAVSNACSRRAAAAYVSFCVRQAILSCAVGMPVIGTRQRRLAYW